MSSAARTVAAWRHELVEGGSEVALVLLHGTGGDEREMVALGQTLAPGVTILAPRGRVSEGGMARFFSRGPHDPLEFPDLRPRTDELAEFLQATRDVYGLAGAALYAVGYSNGANVATSLMLHHPDLLAGAVLLRGLLPAPPPAGLELAGTRVLLAAGSADQMVPPAMASGLADCLRAHGAEVTEQWSHAGHGLTGADLAAARSWLAGLG